MQTSKWLSTVAGAAILACSSMAANATNVLGFYQLNGGVITAIPDSVADPTVLSGFFAAGGFIINVASGTSVPSSLPNLFNSNLQSTHVGTAQDNLKVFLVSLDNTFPTGNVPLTTSFTQNANATTGTLFGDLQSFLGTSTLPFTPANLTQLLGSVSFPPDLNNFETTTNALLASGYSLSALYDLTATGGVISNATVNIKAVPGPIVGAGLPGLIMACGGLLALARRRRKEQV